MPTTHNSFPTISPTDTADVPRDHNALANAVDTALGSLPDMPTTSKTAAGAITELHSGMGDKVDKISGKGLSTNDYTTAEKTKLTGIATGAQVNRSISTQVQAEAGTDNATDMTPLRTAQAIAKIAPIDHVDVWLGSTAGTGTAYTTPANSKLTAYAAGQRLSFQAHVASGANPTLKPGALAAMPIKKPNGNAAKMDAGGLYTVIVNVGVTAFILQGEGGEYGNAVAADVLTGKTVGTDDGIITGTMPYPPNDSAPVVVNGYVTDLYVRPPTGYFNGQNLRIIDAEYTPANFRADKYIFGMQGAIPIRGGVVSATGSAQWPDGGLAVYFPDGYYNRTELLSEVKVTLAQLQNADPQMIASNIRYGVNLWGLNGTLIEGKPEASGTFSAFSSQIGNYRILSVRGLGFRPRAILAAVDAPAQSIVRFSHYQENYGWRWMSYDGNGASGTQAQNGRQGGDSPANGRSIYNDGFDMCVYETYSGASANNGVSFWYAWG